MADITPSKTNTTSTRQVVDDQYDLSYFSGSQAQIYIGDVFVDEITSFQYSVQQSKAPIYSYASQLFDAVAPGQVIVHGSFTVNYIEAGYLWLVLNRYKNYTNQVSKALKNIPGFNLEKVNGGANIPFQKILDDKDTANYVAQANIQRIINGDASLDERNEIYKNLASYASLNNSANEHSPFQEIVNSFEDAVWQEGINDVDLSGRRVDDNMFDDFDMFVTLGDFTKSESSSTVRRIRGVHLLGQSQVIELDNGPVQESYSFFAKTII